VFDDNYRVEVQDVFHGYLLCIFDGDGECLHSEPTSVSYGASFGPDACDVASWQERVAAIIHERNRSNQEKPRDEPKDAPQGDGQTREQT
jgi:hypothetical protein